MTNNRLLRSAEALGHSRLRVFPTASGRRWVCQCACGWGALLSDGRPTVTRATQAEAVSAVRYHLAKAVADHRAALVTNGHAVPAG